MNKDYNKLLNVEEAQKIIFSKFKKLEDNKIPILDSLGSFLSEDIFAPFNLECLLRKAQVVSLSS